MIFEFFMKFANFAFHVVISAKTRILAHLHTHIETPAKLRQQQQNEADEKIGIRWKRWEQKELQL